MDPIDRRGFFARVMLGTLTAFLPVGTGVKQPRWRVTIASPLPVHVVPCRTFDTVRLNERVLRNFRNAIALDYVVPFHPIA